MKSMFIILYNMDVLPVVITSKNKLFFRFPNFNLAYKNIKKLFWTVHIFS